MNNVICIFVDSVVWECVGNTRARVSPTPFLDSLRKEAITTTNLYSHGPYTDAAKTSLFTGRNCLDDFGYYFRENSSPINDFKLFHDAGFETYCLSYPFWLYGKNLRQYIDHQIYTAGFVFGSEWNGLFKYYSELTEQRNLTEDEELLLGARLKLFFDAYIWYFRDILNSKESTILYGKCLEGFDVVKKLGVLEEEYRKFNSDQHAYIYDFCKEGLQHVLSSLDTTRIDSIISRGFHEEIYKRHRAFFRRIKKNNFNANLWRLMPSMKRLLFALRRFFVTRDKSQLLFLENYVLGLTPFAVMRKRWGTPYWQNDNSIHSILNAGLQLIKDREEESKPFYMYLNTDDPHNNIAMFAYDTDDKSVVDDEIRVLDQYAEQLGAGFKGSLLYFLSLRYVDYEIEKFCSRLKELDLWNNTTLMVLTDHGSSYSFYPLHNTRVNCFDDECYHIPMLIRHPGFHGLEVDSYQSSKDILPTVCDLIGIQKPDSFQGYSLLDTTRPKKEYVITEYMGPGCPDMLNRRMWLSIRDKKYVVAYRVGIYEKFEDGEIAEVYDLSKDPNSLYNINYKINEKDIDYLLIILRTRYEEIKENAFRFIEDLKSDRISI